MPNNTWSDAVEDPIENITAAMRAVQSPPRTRSTWRNWENAGIVPDAKRIPLVSERFGIDARYLRAALRAARGRQGPPRSPRGTTAPDELAE